MGTPSGIFGSPRRAPARPLAPLALLAGALWAGCGFSTDYAGTSYQCDERRRCPPGFSCLGSLCVSKAGASRPVTPAETGAEHPPDARPSRNDAGAAPGGDAAAVPEPMDAGAEGPGDGATGTDAGLPAPDAGGSQMDGGVDAEAGSAHDAGVAPSCGSTDLLGDDFDDGVPDDAQWGTRYSFGAARVEERDGKLIIAVSATPRSGSAGYTTSEGYDMTGRGVQVRVDRADGGAPRLEISQTRDGAARVEVSNGQVRAIVTDPSSQDGERAAIPYSSAEHRWWRIREQEGTMHWELSPDGRTWRSLHSEPNPFTPAAVRVRLWAYGDGSEGEDHFDDFNLPNGRSAEPYCPLSSLRDSFDGAALDAVWNANLKVGGCQIEQRGGRAVFTFDGTDAQNCLLFTERAYDACHSAATLELPEGLPVPAAPRTSLVLRSGKATQEIRYDQDQLLFLDYVDGSYRQMLSVPYYERFHRWWRIRMDGATTHWETSQDGLTWVERATAPIPSECSRARVDLNLYRPGDDAASPSRVVFDNFNLAPDGQGSP